MALQIAAPHTWPAAILPALIAMACAAANGYAVSAVMALVLLAICILMQAAVNTFNDYYDYVKGSDSAEDNVDPTDAVLVYNNVNPRSALMLAVGFLLVAFALGAYVIWQAGWIPLAIGIVGAIVVVLYSAGKTPISYLPIGELMSGFVMGGLIPLACYQAITKCLDPLMLVWALPTIIVVGLFMLTNNTCDVEKHIESGRKTLPVNVLSWLSGGWPVLVFMLAASIPLLKALLSNPLAPPARIGAMAQICSVNIALGAFYAAAVFAGGAMSLVL